MPASRRASSSVRRASSKPPPQRAGALGEGIEFLGLLFQCSHEFTLPSRRSRLMRTPANAIATITASEIPAIRSPIVA